MVLARSLARALEESQALIPPGEAWSRDPRSVQTRLLAGLSGLRAAVEERGLDLVEESDPRTTDELLSDWERALGLPDECLPDPETTAERRTLVTARAVGVGGGTPDHLRALLREAGFETVQVVEQVGTPAVCGVAKCGDPIGPGLETLAWTIIAPLTTVRQAACGTARCGDPLAWWGNEVLECVVRRVTPAHTLAVFSYLESCWFVVLDENGDPVQITTVADALQVFDEAGAPVSIPITSDSIEVLDENGDPVAVAITCE